MKYTISRAYDSIYESAVAAGMRYLNKNSNICALVLGVSGGIDSAVTLALAAEVCRRLKPQEIKVVARSLPITGNKGDEVERAQNLGHTFGFMAVDFEEVTMNATWRTLGSAISPIEYGKWLREEEITKEEMIRLGNLKARLRMAKLYDLAHRHKGIVLSTDNLTELLLGFWTLHGDVGDFGFIQNLWKTEVYGLAEFISLKLRKIGTPGELMADAIEACVQAVPTDGLGVTNSDIDQLMPNINIEQIDGRTSYESIDKILMNYLNGTRLPEIGSPAWNVIRRYEASHYKRENPVNVPREVLV